MIHTLLIFVVSWLIGFLGMEGLYQLWLLCRKGSKKDAGE